MFTAALALAAPACLSAEDELDREDLAETTQEIVGGSVANPNQRPEIGQFGGCTATMIRNKWLITASHCWGWFDGRDGAATNAFPDFRTATNGNFSTPNDIVKVDRTFAFTGFFGELHQNDIMIARLETTPTAPGIVPATIAVTPPTSGNVTIWGQGCTGFTPEVGAGILRKFVAPWNAATTALCYGDSGGPKTAATYGAIFGINSALGDSFANPMLYKTQIDALIAEWDAHGSEDIYATGWCTGANERRYEIDYNGDGQPDALCHNRSTGQRRLAIGSQRLIRPSTLSPTSACAGTSTELLTGDFDRDGRTDTLCHYKTSGANYLDLASDGYVGTNAFTNTTWCSHATAQLHTGDFNGDGRTDLLCHDTATGHKWLDYAGTAAPFFTGTTDAENAVGFCSHTGAKLLIGDSDGNGYSDLICHTASTGMIHVDRTYAGHLFEGADDDLAPTADFSFCTTGRVEVGDYDGDGKSDLKCVKSTGTWPSVYAASTGAYSWDYAFGYGGDNAQRTVNAAARPWSYVR